MTTTLKQEIYILELINGNEETAWKIIHYEKTAMSLIQFHKNRSK